MNRFELQNKNSERSIFITEFQYQKLKEAIDAFEPVNGWMLKFVNRIKEKLKTYSHELTLCGKEKRIFPDLLQELEDVEVAQEIYEQVKEW